ncbi:MAG: alpha/beta family hydrolase [Gammaproteobacteria bacterium]
MSSAVARPLTIVGVGQHPVSGLLQVPADARACCVLAHGAGAGMTHPFMVGIAQGLAGRGIATLRYQFPYMERGTRRPDPPALAQATVRAAVEEAARQLPALPLFCGGKSFGGRMSSQAQAASPLPGVRGLVFLGFPLHPPRQPSAARGAHLAQVRIPMLFLQGSRDAFAEPELLQPLLATLRPRAQLHLIEHADHSFHVPARTRRTDAEVQDEMLDALRDWIEAVLA